MLNVGKTLSKEIVLRIPNEWELRDFYLFIYGKSEKNQ